LVCTSSCSKLTARSTVSIQVSRALRDGRRYPRPAGLVAALLLEPRLRRDTAEATKRLVA
jgi:hypothetical protein